MRDDDWRTQTEPPVKDAWVGYTFFRELRPEPAGSTLNSTSSSSTTKGQGDRTSSSMSGSGMSGPPPMPGIAEDGLLPDGLPRDVRQGGHGLRTDSLGSGSDQSTSMTEGVESMLGGYAQRLRTHLHRGGGDGSEASGDSREVSMVNEEGDVGLDYDPRYWSHGPGGHDGTTPSDDERDDWLGFMQDLAGDEGRQSGNQLLGSEASSAERTDWRRSLASEDEDPPSLDKMRARGWTVVRNNLAPPNKESYRGPDRDLSSVDDHEQETPTWMGIATQMPVRPRDAVFLEPQGSVKTPRSQRKKIAEGRRKNLPEAGGFGKKPGGV